MRVFTANNTNDMAAVVYAALLKEGCVSDSRNGAVLRFAEPIALVYEKPWQRVNFCPVRDANPFFHLMEAAWMLAGSQDVAWIEKFNSQIAQYSDDGVTFNAAYGFRLRQHYGDQLTRIVERLQTSPEDRQSVGLLWDAEDLWKETKDKACNLTLVFGVNPRNGALDMIVYNRSNDLIWGSVTGANPVHLTMFQQYVADALGRPMGVYTQVAFNAHVYTENPQWQRLIEHYTARDWKPFDPYEEGVFPHHHIPLFTPDEREAFDHDMRTLLSFMDGSPISTRGFSTAFAVDVLVPMYNAYVYRKYHKNLTSAYAQLNRVEAADWRMAAIAWFDRREAKGV